MSPDGDFSPTGSSSGIKYSEAFKKYKEMLTTNPNSPVYRRIFLKFNTFLFGEVSTPSTNINAEDGDYDSELEKFNAGLHADPFTEDVDVTPVPELPVSPLVQATELPPIHSGCHLTISVTSHASMHTAATSSQVLNIVSSSITLPSVEPEVKGASPLNPEATRPAPRKKGAKSTKKKTTSADPSDRMLRNRR